jgi:L-alanine-DL-glutamate epimerase-like enolase superfamily enzyme
MRLADGTEVLAVRVRLAGGAAGHGYTRGEDVAAARDMAAWDALAISRGLPLHALLGGAARTVAVSRDEEACLPADWTALRADVIARRHAVLRIDPFAWGSLEKVLTIGAVAAAAGLGLALLAPNAHPWELAYCATLAAALKHTDARIIVRQAIPASAIEAALAPGLGIDWSLEPAFRAIAWQC